MHIEPSRFPWKFSAFGNLSLSQGFSQVQGLELKGGGGDKSDRG